MSSNRTFQALLKLTCLSEVLLALLLLNPSFSTCSVLEDHDAEQNFTEPLRNNLGGQDLVLFQSFLSIEDFQ